MTKVISNSAGRRAQHVGLLHLRSNEYSDFRAHIESVEKGDFDARDVAETVRDILSSLLNSIRFTVHRNEWKDDPRRCTDGLQH